MLPQLQKIRSELLALQDLLDRETIVIEEAVKGMLNVNHRVLLLAVEIEKLKALYYKEIREKFDKATMGKN